MPPVFLELTVLEGTVWPPELPFAVSFVVDHVTCLFSFVPPFQSALAVHGVVLLLPLLGCTRRPRVLPFAVFLALNLFSLINVAIGEYLFTETFFHVSQPLALLGVVRLAILLLTPHELPNAVFHLVFEVTLLDRAIRPLEGAFSVLHVLEPVALLAGPIWPFLGAFAMPLVVSPCALLLSPVCPVEGPFTINVVVFLLAFELTATFPHLLSLSVFQPI